MSYRLAIAAFVVGAGASLPVHAQTTATPGTSQAPAAAPAEPAKPAPKPAAPEPASRREEPIKTTNYGDWSLRCREGAAHTCEISQTIEARDRAAPIAKISVGRPGGSGDLHVVVILPNNVSFPSTVHIRTNANDKWGLELDWVRCIPGGCFADALLSSATVAHWHSLDSIGSIVFRDAAGEELSFPMTFHGFGEALDALNKS
jgi:invasion protein IalB